MPANPQLSDSPQREQSLAQVVDQLACPACLSGLSIDAAALRCNGCARVYPIVDGIPVLIPDRPA